MPRSRKAITFSLPPEMDEQLRQVVIGGEDRTVSELLREAFRLYLEEQGMAADRNGCQRMRALTPNATEECNKEDARADEPETPTTRPWPSTPESPVTARTWTCPSPPSCGRSGTTHRRTATSSSASTWMRPRAVASPTARSSAR